ncbi:MAG TPA: sugar phosphate nucleotidyltransferase, partial [Pseudomonadales bacterium]|nr:sugar phosphate nucleotidyltransferase [Pseudomonadales bacterium]
MNVMILAAGRGERMRPLSDRVPKPLLEVGGRALVEHQLLALARAGFKRAVINVHHLGEQIIERLGDGGRYGIEIVYSREAALLGTAGGIRNALPLLGDAPFAV